MLFTSNLTEAHIRGFTCYIVNIAGIKKMSIATLCITF